MGQTAGDVGNPAQGDCAVVQGPVSGPLRGECSDQRPLLELFAGRKLVVPAGVRLEVVRDYGEGRWTSRFSAASAVQPHAQESASAGRDLLGPSRSRNRMRIPKFVKKDSTPCSNAVALCACAAPSARWSGSRSGAGGIRDFYYHRSMSISNFNIKRVTLHGSLRRAAARSGSTRCIKYRSLLPGERVPQPPCCCRAAYLSSNRCPRMRRRPPRRSPPAHRPRRRPPPPQTRWRSRR
jgi:hypothetical protein